MNPRWWMAAFLVVGTGCLVLLFDTLVTQIVATRLGLLPERAGQAMLVYGFGVVAGALGALLVSFAGYDELAE